MKCLSVENFRGMLFNVNELTKTASMLRICKKCFYFTSQTIPKKPPKKLTFATSKILPVGRQAVKKST